MASSPFTVDEKRFVLAEMIKSSTVDIDDLALFIQAHNVSPNWMQMQLPHGRNMTQCMQVAEHMSRARSRAPGRGQEGTAGTAAAPDQHAPPAPPTTKTSPSMPKQLARIAPRPANGTAEGGGQEQAAGGMPKPPPKKRGRPSRADMAKRELRPNLPQYIAPRPPQQMAGFQAILPATSRPQDVVQTASPAATPVTAQSPPSDGAREKKRRRVAGTMA